MKNSFYLLLCIALSVSCSGKKQSAAEAVSDTIPTVEVAEDVNIRPADKHVPFYDEIGKYDNNLSSIASGVRFVKLDDEPLFRDFLIHDVQQCDSFLFLLGSEHIFMYDTSGKFLRQIGRKGQGPGEYVNLNAPLQLDEKNRIVYVTDGYTSRFLSYDFDGNLLKDIRYANSEWSQAYLLDSVTVMINTNVGSRFQPSQTKKLILQDYDRKTLKSFPSYLYPVERPRGNFAYGVDNILWRCGKDFYLLEYGNDTIFQITREQLIPALILTGDDLKLSKDEWFSRDKKDKAFIAPQMMKPSSGIFESNRFLIASLRRQFPKESYFAVLDKKTGNLWRTGKHTQPFIGEPAPYRTSEYFIDDMVSGLPVEPIYYSQGETIGLIAAEALLTQKEAIAEFVAKHPTEEGKKLQKLLETMNEESGSVLCFVKLK